MAELIPGDNQLAGARTPRIYNVTLTSANTEYPQTLPTNCRKFSIRPRTSSHVIKLAYASGESGSNYVTIDTVFYYEDLVGVNGLTVYLQSPTAGAIVEIVAWN